MAANYYRSPTEQEERSVSDEDSRQDDETLVEAEVGLTFICKVPKLGAMFSLQENIGPP